MKPNFSTKIVQVICLLVCLGSLGWLGFNLVTRNAQTQQLKRANNLLAKKKYPQAIVAYDQLLAEEVEPRDSLWIDRGFAFAGLKQYQQMQESCAEGTKLNPQAARGWNCQGEALYYLGQYKAALAALERAISNDSQQISFWLNKARVLRDLQQYPQAIEASKNVIKLAEALPNNAATQQNLAAAYNHQGQALLKTQQNQAALTAFNRALKHSPQIAAKQGKAIALYRLNRYTESIKVFQEILQQDNLTSKQQAVFWLYTGISHCQTQNITAAKKAFTQVLQLRDEAELNKMAKIGCGIQ